ncbi:MAG: hypothetical protein IOC39_12400 [Burkholderia sp.]|jgi:hypothetical protein|uniref:hypothetical protein n=1 Tax=Burkholderia sp. TaxID=36773 RepID=UPI0025833194|nr:hypothetical protein [Burkholderia sp.]MCA3777585.1 hypothetical protein [Burkholderia sp.]MCA3786787.1 hypothetical protein [Burkholderia sp.]MCA3792528.1 hypothetical protein [Burkholderia sp.]MCA3801241.1 hypothetical protein [Burkholderia sp.]MCA3811958.1 hypothetical protein [Burkholderia sp.]
MIFAIDSVKAAKRAIAAMVGHPRMRTGYAWRREGNTHRINAMRCVSMQRAKQVERMTVRGRDPLRVARDIDMRKTSLDRPEPDGYMPSLFSTD